MARSNFPVSLKAGGGAIRLLGNLKATTAVGNSEHPEELICIAGYKTVKVVGAFSGVAGDPDLKIHPMTVDGQTRLISVPTAVTITATQIEIKYDTEGEHYIEVEVVCDADDTATITWLEVFGSEN
jgi:hypothetical protein